MSFKQWEVGNRLTEKHLGGQPRRLANCLVSGGEVEVQAGLKYRVIVWVSLIGGYEQRPAGSFIAPVDLDASSTYFIWLTWDEEVKAVKTVTTPPSGYSVANAMMIAKVLTAGASISQIINMDNEGCVDRQAISRFATLPKGSPNAKYINTAVETATAEQDLLINTEGAGRLKGFKIILVSTDTDDATARLRMYFDDNTNPEIDLPFDGVENVGGPNGISGTSNPGTDHTMEINLEGDFGTNFRLAWTPGEAGVSGRTIEGIITWEDFVL